MGIEVSVIICTYNSSPFIAETLQSVYGQTYGEIELIITDDASSDDTVDVCRQWLDSFGQRFSRYMVITSERNTGVAANANRGLAVARGKWVKYLGADDIFKDSCLSDNIGWVTENEETRVLFSQVEIYRDKFIPESLIGMTPENPFTVESIMAPGRSAGSQYRMLLVSDRIHYSPSVFIDRDTLNSVGGFDERFRLLEDYPLWLRLTKNGIVLSFMDKVTVCYRMHSSAINNTGISYLVNPNYFRSEHFRRIYTYPFLPTDVMLEQRFRWLALQIFRIRWMNRDKRIMVRLKKLLEVYLNPFRYLIALRKLLDSRLRSCEYYN